jgi:hypothetical protein
MCCGGGGGGKSEMTGRAPQRNAYTVCLVSFGLQEHVVSVICKIDGLGHVSRQNLS